MATDINPACACAALREQIDEAHRYFDRCCVPPGTLRERALALGDACVADERGKAIKTIATLTANLDQALAVVGELVAALTEACGYTEPGMTRGPAVPEWTEMRSQVRAALAAAGRLGGVGE